MAIQRTARRSRFAVATEVKEKRLSKAQRKLVWEMAHDRRVIFTMKHPRMWCGIRYAINSFPMRTLHGTMVATLAQSGYLRMDKRGYYVLTTKGQLEASIKDLRKRT
jgi:hypothetical protein